MVKHRQSAVRRRYALVELFVDVPAREGNPWRLGWKSVIRECILSMDGRQKRLEAVKRVLCCPELKTADVIVFPGWTLVGSKIPMAVRRLIGDREVFIEMVSEDSTDEKSNQASVLRNGEEVAGPTWQLFSDKAGAAKGSARLAAELLGDPPEGSKRRWTGNCETPSALLLCGEVNTITGQRVGGGLKLTPFDKAVLTALDDARVILNPAHTRTNRFEMRRKREYLAAGRLLVTVANLTPRFYYVNAKGERRRAVAQSTAEAFQGTRRFSSSEMRSWPGAKLIPIDGGHRVVVFEA